MVLKLQYFWQVSGISCSGIPLLNICWTYLSIIYLVDVQLALLDIYGDHSLICGAGSERTNRHNYVRGIYNEAGEITRGGTIGVAISQIL